MENPLPKDYKTFLYSDWSDTFFLEFRENGRLLAVAVCDRVKSGLSAVYSFFDPGMSNRSLGTYCVLKMIDQAALQGLDYLYLGYLIHDSGKMRYKQNFRPLEIFSDNLWRNYLGRKFCL